VVYMFELMSIIENTFLSIKDWRGIATRYDKNVKSFIACPNYVHCAFA
jgi:transposase